MAIRGRKIAVGGAVAAVLLTVAAVAAHPSGVGFAGLSRGITAPMDNPYHLALYLTIGIWAAWLGREALILLPFSALVALASGMVAHLPEEVYGRDVGLMLLVQAYALLAGVMPRRPFLLAQVVLGGACFWLGGNYLVELPDIAPPVYYIGGVWLCALLVASIGATLGLVVSSLFRPTKKRVIL